jgi:hypothetical protein
MAADAVPQKVIDIYEGNPRYWAYGGEPVLLLGGSVEDNLFQIPDLARELDTLAAAGGNYVRCTMSSRDPGNVWPFAKEGERYDLDRLNDEYWRRFETFLAETERRGIIVQIEVWATFDFYRDNWDVNPFNPKNNVNYTAEETGLPTEVTTHPTRTENNFFWSVPAERNQETVLKHQRVFVDELLSHALKHGNVLYCMDNETSVTPEWGAYWADYIRQAVAAAGRKVHTTEMWDPWDLDHPMHRATWQHPETYTFVDVSQNNHQTGQVHYDNALRLLRRISDPVRPTNNVKIYGADAGQFGTTRDGIERFWRDIFAGMASARFHRPTSGIGLSGPAQRMIRSARDVTDAIEITRCEAHPDLLSGHGENAAFCLAEPGRQYAVYFTAGGAVDLDASGLDGPATLRWYDIDNGGWGQASAVEGGGKLALRTPGTGQSAAIVRTGDRSE